MSVKDFFGKEIKPHFIAHAQSPWGKILLVTLFSVFMPMSAALAPIIIPAIVLCSFAPAYRWHITAYATLAIFIHNPFWFSPLFLEHAAAQENVTDHINPIFLRYGIGLFFFCFALVVILCKRRFTRHFLFRRPVLNLLLFYFLLVFLASQHLWHGLAQVLLWSFIAIFGAYFWFLCYALLDNRPASPHLLLQIGTFHPFWGSTTTPYGKGVANLRKMEATDDTEYAIARIKGVRLIIQCFILRLVLIGFRYTVYKYLTVPNFDVAFSHQITGIPYSPAYCWASLVASFFDTVMDMAISGNSIVACARMAGFQLLRNTYKPLESKTISEFWNRFYFYFKELLVEFFFYPAFLTCFKRYKRLRIVFATFMAACVGNIIFHFMRDIEWVLKIGLWKAITGLQTYAFYSLLLTIGIVVSQLRSRPSLQGGFLRRNFLPSFCVCVFFCFIHIFDNLDRQQPLSASFVFLFHLFGLEL